MGRIRIFVSFDRDHDGDLEGRLVEESQKAGSGFEISGHSDSAGSDRARRRIGEADEVIVICGEHTEQSIQVSAEMRAAQEQDKPYFLLWGRREAMCTKPVGARAGDHMYSWATVQDQVLTTLRNATPLDVPEHCKRP